MIFSLSLKNIRKNLLRAILLIFSVMIGSGVLTIFAGVWFGMHSFFTSGEDISRLIVRPNAPSNITSFILGDPVEFEAEEVEQISKIKGVKNVIPQNFLRRATTLEIRLGLADFSGLYEIDTMVFGSSSDLFKDISEKEFNSEIKPIPVVVSSTLLDLYNFFLAEQTRLPRFEYKDFIGKKFKLYLDYSSVIHLGNKDKAEVVECEIIGFSHYAQVSGITIPYEMVESLSYDPVGPHMIYIEAENALALRDIESELDNLGNYRTEVPGDFRALEKTSWYLAIILGALALIIWFSIALSLALTFIALGEERRYEVGILRIIGASRSQISRLFYYEAGLIGLIGSSLGVLLGSFSGEILNTYFKNKFMLIDSLPGDIFILNIETILAVILFSLLVCILADALPARRASRSVIFKLIHEK